MKFRWLLISTILFLIITAQVQAVDISYKGMLESYLEGYREDGEEYFTSLTEFNLKLDTGTFNYNIHLDSSILFDEKGIEDLAEFSPGGEFELNKLYLNYWLSKGQFKLGKQRIAWGSGYFYNPTDLINPLKEELKSDISPREATDSIMGAIIWEMVPWRL